MTLLKILYVCWVVLLAFLWFTFLSIAYNPDVFEVALEFIGLGIAPLVVYNLWIFAITGIKKYLKIFFILFTYYPLAVVLYLVID